MARFPASLFNATARHGHVRRAAEAGAVSRDGSVDATAAIRYATPLRLPPDDYFNSTSARGDSNVRSSVLIELIMLRNGAWPHPRYPLGHANAKLIGTRENAGAHRAGRRSWELAHVPEEWAAVFR
jgi:hypothetical protein